MSTNKVRQFLRINTPNELSLQLGVGLGLLEKTITQIGEHYIYDPECLDKKGKKREVYKPDRLLKMIQRRISKLLDRIYYPISIQGAIKGRSTKSNALLHVGKKYVATFDIKDFFPSIDYHVVYRTFREQYCAPNVARMLTRLTTADAHLAQGFVNSPKISGLVLLEIDRRLTTLFKAYQLNHSFWIDDLVVSGDYPIKRLTSLIKKVFQQAGFTIHDEGKKKFTIKHRRQQQKATGMVINYQPSMPKEWRLKLRNDLYFCAKYGTAPHLRKIGLEMKPESYLALLRGRVAFSQSIRPNDGIDRLSRILFRG